MINLYSDQCHGIGDEVMLVKIGSSNDTSPGWSRVWILTTEVDKVCRKLSIAMECSTIHVMFKNDIKAVYEHGCRRDVVDFLATRPWLKGSQYPCSATGDMI